ncbi:MAG: Rpn family recombination-promoting nuclease/putative transposase [Lachnospiraceae bacterium]|nr:Rpn family recombination-promoting nuclease/putative transposase [Lachnospiraceae bacterium]
MGMLKSRNVDSSFQTASGPIPYNLTNDYMFHIVLQENEFVLRGLIGSLLQLDQSEIKSVKVTNPITLGDEIDSKVFVLDIHVLMNDDTVINLEMQIVRQEYWPERSLSYLCRSYDSLYRGEEYGKAKRAIHIGILDFTLFKENPEFYASNKLLNVKNHHLFSDKFILNVLDLTKIELATDEDRLCEIDHWARLFRAKTWEDLRMIAEKNQYMNEAAAEIYMRNSDENIREQCLAREEYWKHERWVRNQMEEKDRTIANQEQTITDQKQTITDQKQMIIDQEQRITDQEQTITDREQIIADQKQMIADQNRMIEELQKKLNNQ